MNKYIIYRIADGSVFGEQVTDKNTEDRLISIITKGGGELLRPNAIVGNDEADAIARLNKASQLRQEAGQIAEKGKTIVDDTQRSMDEVADAKARQQAMEEAQAYGNESEGKLGAVSLLKQMGRSVPKLATSIVSGIMNPDPSLGRLQTIADRYQLPYESDLAQSTIGDPTLVPSMFIPGVGEARAASVAGKILPAIAKGGRIEKAVAPAIRMGTDVGAQTVASEVPDIATGEISPEETTKRLLMGIGGSAGAEAAGKGLVGGGRKILQSVIKPKTGSDVNQNIVDDLMGATLPDSDKKVVRAGSSLESMYNDLENAITAYGEKQAGSLDKTQKIGLLNDIGDMLRYNRVKLQSDLDNRVINEDAFNKASDILDMEERRLMGTSLTKQGTPNPISEVNLHEAKKDYGNKSRYDIKNTSTGDPTTRELYNQLYGETRGLITSSQAGGNPFDVSSVPEELRASVNEKITPMVREVLLNPATSPTERQIIIGQIARIIRDAQGISTPYDKYSKAMTPLMEARDPVGKALERTNRNQSLTLPMIMGASAGATSGYGIPAMISGGALPALMNANRAGTLAYRSGEAIPTIADRYAIPALVRTQNEE